MFLQFLRNKSDQSLIRFAQHLLITKFAYEKNQINGVMDASRNYHVSKLKNKFMRKLNYNFFYSHDNFLLSKEYTQSDALYEV